MTTKSKQLVSAGHELASELKADCGAVDVRSVANLLTELASALDVQSARSDALAAKLNDVCAENAALKSVIGECQRYFIAGIRNAIRPTNEGYLHMRCDTVADETPATDAWVNEQRAVGVDEAINVILTMMDRIAPAHHAISMLRAHAAQLRGSQV